MEDVISSRPMHVAVDEEKIITRNKFTPLKSDVKKNNVKLKDVKKNDDKIKDVRIKDVSNNDVLKQVQNENVLGKRRASTESQKQTKKQRRKIGWYALFRKLFKNLESFKDYYKLFVKCNKIYNLHAFALLQFFGA